MHIVVIKRHFKAEFREFFNNIFSCDNLSKTAFQPFHRNVNFIFYEFLRVEIAVSNYLHIGVNFFEHLHRESKSLVTSFWINSLFIS